MRGVLAIATLGCISTMLIHGQLTRGFISGTVQDVSGAVLTQVRIRIVNGATGLERSTVTNGSGSTVSPRSSRVRIRWSSARKALKQRKSPAFRWAPPRRW